MPDEPNPEEQALVSKAQISKVKTGTLKNGLAKQKNLISAKKKDLISRQLHPPEEFLQSDATFDKVLAIAHTDAQDIVVRRYVCVCSAANPYSMP